MPSLEATNHGGDFLFPTSAHARRCRREVYSRRLCTVGLIERVTVERGAASDGMISPLLSVVRRKMK
mgnify:CR=1 FL=1